MKPEAGADGASENAAKPADTVAAVARRWQRQAQQSAVMLQRFDAPGEIRDLPRARFELVPGTLFHVPARPHDTKVVSDVPFVAVLFVGAERFSRALSS